jgi:hypothetical protein
MFSFDDIAGETLVVLNNTGSVETSETGAFQRDLLDAVDAALRDVEPRPRMLVRLLRRACLEDQCRGILLGIRGQAAQNLVNAMQLVRRRSCYFDAPCLYLLLLVSGCFESRRRFSKAHPLPAG